MSKQAEPPYPYNKRTDTITLPPAIEQEIRQLVQAGQRTEAMQRIMQLTGAGLKVSKDYMDYLSRPKRT